MIARRVGLTPSGPFNLGDPNDYRVPDLGYHRAPPPGAWQPTAALVVEILSPGDETFEKFGFYAAHDVDEIVVADLSTQRGRRSRTARQGGDPASPTDSGAGAVPLLLTLARSSAVSTRRGSHARLAHLVGDGLLTVPAGWRWRPHRGWTGPGAGRDPSG